LVPLACGSQPYLGALHGREAYLHDEATVVVIRGGNDWPRVVAGRGAPVSRLCKLLTEGPGT
jgi:hypothetical protein